MTRKNFVWLVATCFMVAALVLASCGPAATTTPPTTTPPTTKPPTTTPPTTAPPSGPQYGGTIRMTSHDPTYDPYTWDPADASWNNDHYTMHYMDRLLIGDLMRGPKGTNEYPFTNREGIVDDILTGCLAESWETPDAKTVIFHLRKGVKWHNKAPTWGREFVAADVKYSMERLAAAPRIGTARLDFIKEWVVIDKYTIKVSLNYFRGDWAYLIGWGAFCQIVAPEAGSPSVIADWRNATGTGAWILKDYVKGSAATYARNPDYYLKARIGGKEYGMPFADTFVDYIMPDRSTRVAAVRTAKLDICHIVDPVDVEQLQKSNPELKWNSYPGVGSMVLYWRMDRTPTDNKKVRLALNMAIDRQAYIKTILNGKGIMLNRCVLSIDPETMYTPLEKLPAEAKDQFTYNPARAKQLLAEAGYPTGFTFKLIAPSYYPVPETISLIESWWKEIGVKLDAKIVDPAVFTSTMYGKGHEMGVLLYRAIPSAFTELRTYSSLAEIWNPSCYNDPDYQKGFEDMKTTVDPVARAAKIKALNIMVLSAYTGVLFPEGYGWTASQPWVRNYHGECGVGYWWFGPIYSHVWIDTAMKKAATGRE